MNDQFKVGTVCIGQNFVRAIKNNGAECEIIGGLELRLWGVKPTGEFIHELCYKVRWTDGHRSNEKPIHLRRKPPKQSDSQWADEAVRKLKKQSSDHVAVQLDKLIPEETA